MNLRDRSFERCNFVKLFLFFFRQKRSVVSSVSFHALSLYCNFCTIYTINSAYFAICQQVQTENIVNFSILFSDVCMNAYNFWKRVDSLNKGTAQELAEIVGIKYVTMLGMRTRCTFPKLDKIISISKALNVSIDYLLLGDTERLSREALYVEQNPDAKLLVRAIMQNPHLLSVISTLLRTDVDVQNKEA